MNRKPNALAVANYFIEIAKREGKGITQLGLMKRVYIAHGFSLAIHHKSLLDPRFDKVEAWKYGPVIPNVYHSFKQYRSNPILEKTVIMTWDDSRCERYTNFPNWMMRMPRLLSRWCGGVITGCPIQTWLRSPTRRAHRGMFATSRG